MLGLLSSPSQPLPPRGKGSEQAGHDLRVKLSKQRQLLVMNVMDRDELISYFDVSLGMLTFKVQRGFTMPLTCTHSFTFACFPQLFNYCCVFLNLPAP